MSLRRISNTLSDAKYRELSKPPIAPIKNKSVFFQIEADCLETRYSLPTILDTLCLQGVDVYRNERWVDIEEFEGIYKISNFGRLAKFVGSVWKIQRVGVCKTYGYAIASLTKNKNSKRCFIHRLVYTNFVDEIPQGYTVSHKNGIRTDNRVTNLRLLTIEENFKYGSSLEKSIKGHCRIVAQNIKDNKLTIYKNIKQCCLALKGFKSINIFACCDRIISTYKGYIFRYYKDNLFNYSEYLEKKEIELGGIEFNSLEDFDNYMSPKNHKRTHNLERYRRNTNKEKFTYF